jgi:hypothetical protein
MPRRLRFARCRTVCIPCSPVSVRALHVGQGLTDVGGQFHGRRSSRRFTGWPSVLYIRYPLSLRQVEDLLFERGIDVCHEAVQFW